MIQMKKMGFNKSFLTLFAFLATLLFTKCATHTNSHLEVRSPDGKLNVICYADEKHFSYQVNRNGDCVIKESKLGFLFNNQIAMQDGFKIVNSSITSVDNNWEQVWGEKKVIRNHYNELLVELQEVEGLKRQLNIIFRVFNDGIGFRYVFPEQNNLTEFQISDEVTEFNLNEDYDSWSVKAYQNDRYEYLYQKHKLSALKDTVHTPFTLVNKNGLAISIHEANLTDYASMTLYSTDQTKLHCNLVPWANGVKVYGKTSFITPWRTVQIVDKPTELITSSLILNLNEPCKLDDVSWIKPAKYIGIWWEMHLGKSSWGQGDKHGANTANVKKYMDFAAENGFQGVLVEGWNQGWDGDWWQNGDIFNFTTPYPDFDIAEITSYGKSKGVGLIGHHETGAGVRNYESQLEDAMAFYNQYGVEYVKTGYVNSQGMNKKEWHHSQYGVRHYRKVIEEAAKNKIMVCAHEAIKPTGIRRTYPNMMSRESARGQEFNAWGPNGGNPPNHEPTLVFTRLLGGPMDFTPGIFNITLPTRENNQVNTTLAKQLALYVTLYSPLQMAADLPENYENKPAFQFIKDVVADWEDTKVLNGEVGEFVTIARKDRNSDNWFLGSISNEKSRDFEIDLSFLDIDKKYKAEIYADGESAHYRNNPTDINISKKILTSDQKIKVKLAPGGGLAIAFKMIQ